MNEVQIRNFKEEDIEEIPKIFEKHYSGFVGHIPRTPETWKYLILDRPLVESGIFVAETDDEIRGYIVVGIKKTASARVAVIYEFCAENTEFAMELLEKAISFSRKQRVDYILAQPPCSDDPICHCLTRYSFAKMTKPATKIMVTLSNPVRILKILVDVFNKERDLKDAFKNLDKTILLKIGEAYITMSINGGEIKVRPKREKADITLEMSPINFLRIFLGLTSPFRAYIQGDLKIKGLFPNFFIFRLIRSLQLHRHIFFPLTEHF